MAQTKDGKHKSSKFRAARYDKEHASDAPKEPAEPKGESETEQGKESSGGGAREQANRMEVHKQGNPETKGFGYADEGGADEPEPDEGPVEENAEEQIHPGIHDEVKQVVAEHGPAHTLHVTHDHEGQRSHVHSIHADGHEHHADHAGPDHHVNAHHHSMHASGMPVPQDRESPPVNPNPSEGEDSYSEY